MQAEWSEEQKTQHLQIIDWMWKCASAQRFISSKFVSLSALVDVAYCLISLSPCRIFNEKPIMRPLLLEWLLGQLNNFCIFRSVRRWVIATYSVEKVKPCIQIKKKYFPFFLLSWKAQCPVCRKCWFSLSSRSTCPCRFQQTVPTL